jgi:cytochrome c oxidase assembly factor 2
VDRRQFADSYETPDGKIRRRRKRKDVGEGKGEESGTLDQANAVAPDGTPPRECPIPKPGGIVGQMMGFKNEERLRPTEVVVQKLSTRNVRPTHQSQNESHDAS